MKRIVSSVVVVVMAIGVGVSELIGHAQQTTVATTEITKDVRKKLASLPYYGVFDLLTFQVDPNGVVNLGGYVFNDSLKKDAEREAREVKGVTEVQNKIAIASGASWDYAIHILVNNRTVTLAGVVDNEGAKTLAGLKTRGVTGVSEVNNDLQWANRDGARMSTSVSPAASAPPPGEGF